MMYRLEVICWAKLRAQSGGRNRHRTLAASRVADVPTGGLRLAIVAIGDIVAATYRVRDLIALGGLLGADT